MVVETARLRLEPLRLSDLAEHHAAIGSDPAVMWTGEARTLDESRAALEAKVRHWDEHGFGLWVVRPLDGGPLLGHAGLQRLQDTDEVEVAYYLARTAWGSGYATEVAAASLRFGFERLALDSIAAVVRARNEASQRVLGKLGLRHEPARDGRWYGLDDVQYWRIGRADWRPPDSPYRVRQE